MQGKVKGKRSRHSKKVTRVPDVRKGVSKGSRKTPHSPQVRGKKKRGKKSQSQRNPRVKKTQRLVTVTKPPRKSKREQQLEREVQRLRAQLGKSKRSEAAKKGWENRRAKIAQKRAESIQSVVEAQIAPIATELTPEFLERQQHLREPHVQRQIQQRLVEKMPEFFTRGEEYFERVEPQIMLRLIIAEQEGDFHDTVMALADEYDYDSHSIYELWNGYELDS